MLNSPITQNQHAPGLEILFFKTAWSGMSRLFEQRIARVLARFNRLDILKIVDLDVDPDSSEQYGIYTVPAVVFICAGRICGRLDKVVNEQEISQFLNLMEDHIHHNKYIQTED